MDVVDENWRKWWSPDARGFTRNSITYKKTSRCRTRPARSWLTVNRHCIWAPPTTSSWWMTLTPASASPTGFTFRVRAPLSAAQIAAALSRQSACRRCPDRLNRRAQYPAARQISALLGPLVVNGLELAGGLGTVQPLVDPGLPDVVAARQQIAFLRERERVIRVYRAQFRVEVGL